MHTITEWMHDEVMDAVRDEGLPPTLIEAFDAAVQAQIEEQIPSWVQQVPAEEDVKNRLHPQLHSLRSDILATVRDVKRAVKAMDGPRHEAAKRVASAMKAKM